MTENHMSGRAGCSPEDIEPFARRHGLTNLSAAHLQRMQELAPKVSDLGANLPRPLHKHDAPSPRIGIKKNG